MVQKLLAALLLFRNRILMPQTLDFQLTCLRETVAVEIAWQFNLSGLFTCPVCAPFLLICHAATDMAKKHNAQSRKHCRLSF